MQRSKPAVIAWQAILCVLLLRSIQVFPADEDLIAHLRVNRRVRRFLWLFMLDKPGEGGINLCPIAKGHDHEVLVISLTISVHLRITLTLTNWTRALNETNTLHMLYKTGVSGAKIVDPDSRLEIKAGEHVKHCCLSD